MGARAAIAVPCGAEIRIAVISMDANLSGPVARAGQSFQKILPGLTLTYHAASDWRRDPKSLDACKKAVARADIVVAGMLFLEEHVQAILPALEARREHCDAIVGLLSAAEVVKITRLGRFRMDKPSTGPIALLKKLRGGKDKAAAGAHQAKMLRQLPKILKFIPGTAQDVRAYFLTLQYWLGGSDDNMLNLVKFLVDRYAAGEREILCGALAPQEPVEYPEVGVYHPALSSRVALQTSALPHARSKRPTVGLLILRSYVLSGDSGHYDGVIAALEARGLRVVPAFAGGLDSRPAIEKFFMANGKPTIDALVSLTGFSLVGGPAYNDAGAAAEMLGRLDVPYISAHALEFQTLNEWGVGSSGLSPVESTLMVAIPELDGATNATVFGGRASNSEEECRGCARRCKFEAEDGRGRMRPCPERADMLARRVAKLISLRQKQEADRKLAVVIFNFPPNGGSIGTAAHLSVFESLFNTLTALAREGYDVPVPPSVDALRDAVLGGNSGVFGADANIVARVSASDHIRREMRLSEIETQWGPAPGRHQSDGRSIQILGARFGKVLVAVQPSFGYEGDPMRLLFEKGFAPTHAFAAFYRYLREEFAADAVLHFGTHGALEFMPGKQTGLGAQCWPDYLIDDLPNFYFYAANNPSEAAIAKRRAAATTISYLTPGVANAGLYKELAELKAMIERRRAAALDAEAERAELASMIQAQAALLDLAQASPEWGARADGAIERVRAALYEMEQALIPQGLHVAGAPMSLEERIEILASMAPAEGAEPAPAKAIEAIAGGVSPKAAAKKWNAAKHLAELDRLAGVNAALMKDAELPAILKALGGGFTAPVAGGDLIRNPAILPTGRNIHGFDPFLLPSNYAVLDGARQSARLIDRHVRDGRKLPEMVAIVLWGTDNLKSEGAQIAQALALIGAKPRSDSYGRLVGAELIPSEKLNRPRIDIVVTLSGIFRDLLPLQSRLLADAAFLAATADEREDQNFVRKHTLAYQAKHGCDLETAALRVFSNADGAYGANVNHLVEAGCWDEEDELADAYTKRKCFAFGQNGAVAAQETLLNSILADVDLAYQNLESVELGVTTIDHYFDTLGGIGRAVKRARGAEAPIYIGDQTRGGGAVRTLTEQVALESRTRTLNPKWYEGMLKHGYEGVRQIEAQVTNTLGWSATTGQVDPWVYQRITETFVLDKELRNRIATLNPKSCAKVANRLLEASDRKYWTPDENTLRALQEAGEELEDRIEGVMPVGAVA